MKLLTFATTGYEALSFVNRYSGDNQIKLHPGDAEMTAFWSPKVVFWYQVMPLGIKNAGARYQRSTIVIFKEMLGDTIKCYTNDKVVKPMIDHLEHLRRQTPLASIKDESGKMRAQITLGKFIGFVVLCRGVEIRKDKGDHRASTFENKRELRVF